MSLTIDTHIHLAGTGCCDSGCWIAPAFRKRYTFRILQFLQKVSQKHLETTIDRDWAARISQYVTESSLDYGVVLGFDGVFHHQNGNFDQKNSQMIIPPSWVFEVCRTHRNLLPGPSINPHSSEALSTLEQTLEQKPVLIKWLPSAQAIDAGSKKLTDFYKLLADHSVPLLIHMGGERTFREVAPEFNDIESLHEPLNHGVKVICAHSATPVLGSKEPNHIPRLIQMLETYPHLWVDNSGLLNPSRFRHPPQLIAEATIHNRTLYGSDWPVPAHAWYYIRHLGWKQVRELEAIHSPLEKDLRIKRALGYSQDTERRAPKVLANLEHWTT